MLYSEIKTGCDKICELLDKWELRNGLNSLRRLADAVNDESLSEKVEQTGKEYEEFLRTRIESNGVDETVFFRTVLKKAYTLTDEFRYKLALQMSPLFLFVREQGWKQGHDYSNLHDLIRCQPVFEDRLHSILFHRVFCSSFLTQQEAEDLLTILHDDENCCVASCQIVSALFLSIQVCFDVRKLDLLSAAAASSQQEVRARGYICLLSALSLYQKRLPAWEEETGALLNRLVESDPDFGAMVLLVTERLAIERETEEIVRRMREEILPEIARTGKEQMEAAVEAMNDVEEEVPSEWTVTPSDKLAEQLREMNRLQAEGADMMYISFMGAKRIPFFTDPSHWFLPFIADHAEVQHAIAAWGGNPSVAHDIEVLTQFCNSDKYSFLLGLHSKTNGVPPPLIELLCDNTENIDAFRKSQVTILDRERVQQIVGQYIPDLYRFYHLYPYRSELLDPFASIPDFHTFPPVKPYLLPSFLRHIGHCFFRRKLYSESLAVFQHQADTFLDTFEKEGEGGILCKGDIFGSMEEMKTIVEKTGYCYQQTGNYQKAILYYLWSYSNSKENTWLAEHIAQCYRQTSEPDRAFDYYRVCEKSSPKDVSLLIKMGRCLIGSGKYPEALEYFYKADFYHSNTRTWRPIAWLLFLLGRYDEALRYYDNILKGEHSSMEDYLNAGHAACAAQYPTSQIMVYYIKALSQSKDFETFTKHFQADIDHLHRAGIRDEQLALFFELFNYFNPHSA